ncbi:MAG: pantoate--beta-alanine ligase [Cyclobacteriaceae bacterium]|jgi:pantoate--beta-alanine ligase
MQVVTSPRRITELMKALRNQGKSIGLVPTMGALHDGHASLFRESLKYNDITVVSVFVNPMQFNNQDDFNNYPRPFAQDQKILEGLGVDVLYAPSEKEMYPESPLVNLEFGVMAEIMEGAFRPGHFDGVGLVIAKLLNQVLPDKAYFGLKDLQQFLLISRLVKDLSFTSEVVGLPIIREKSGLAMSSRNMRLSDGGLQLATNIYTGLEFAQKNISDGFDVDETKLAVFDFYSRIDGLEVEYLEFVNPDDLSAIEPRISPKDVAICVAAYVEGIRLIDNIYLRQD